MRVRTLVRGGSYGLDQIDPGSKVVPHLRQRHEPASGAAPAALIACARWSLTASSAARARRCLPGCGAGLACGGGGGGDQSRGRGGGGGGCFGRRLNNNSVAAPPFPRPGCRFFLGAAIFWGELQRRGVTVGGCFSAALGGSLRIPWRPVPPFLCCRGSCGPRLPVGVHP